MDDSISKKNGIAYNYIVTEVSRLGYSISACPQVILINILTRSVGGWLIPASRLCVRPVHLSVDVV